MDNQNKDPEVFYKAVRQLNQQIVAECIAAAEAGNSGFLEEIGIERKHAVQLAELKARSITGLVGRSRTCLFKITPNENFGVYLQSIIADEIEEENKRELFRVGATQQMLNDLGYGVTRADYISRTHQTGAEMPRGRPRRLTALEKRQCHTYWTGVRANIERDPLLLLIETCDVLDLRVSQIWGYIGPDGPRNEASLIKYSLATPPEERPWVQVMFNPNYGSSGTGQGAK